MKKAGIACFTRNGALLADRIAQGLGGTYDIIRYEKEKQTLTDWCRDCFSQADALIFIGACGIAVRTIAPHLKSKTEDPAVVVLDEKGQFVISLLSGHLGGANEFALTVAGLTGAVPVITTASDVRGKTAVDVFAQKNHLAIASMKAAKNTAAAILDGRRVELYCSGKIDGTVPPEFTMVETGESGKFEPFADSGNSGSTGSFGSTDNSGGAPSLIWISEREYPGDGPAAVLDQMNGIALCQESDAAGGADDRILHLIPKAVTIGIGCRKGKDAQSVRQVVEKLLREEHIPVQAVLGAASIDLKKNEEGILRTCEALGIPFRTYSAEELNQVPGQFQSSEFVRKTTGTDNVCERSALALAGSGGTLIRNKYAKDGVTAALAVKEWGIRFGE